MRVRYRHTPAPATITPLDNDRVRVVFDEPQRAITPGQATVFYRGDEVLGGGWIVKSQVKEQGQEQAAVSRKQSSFLHACFVPVCTCLLHLCLLLLLTCSAPAPPLNLFPLPLRNFTIRQNTSKNTSKLFRT